jgi:hypothetical protein
MTDERSNPKMSAEEQRKLAAIMFTAPKEK